MRLGSIGAGAVGSACLGAVVMRGFAREVVVLDRHRETAEGLATDVQYGAVLSPATALRDGDYSDLEGASLVMVTAGVNEKIGGATNRDDPAGRLRLLDTNVEVYKDIVARLHAVAPEAVMLVITDPPDPLANTARMLGHAARRLDVNPLSVHAQILGEHGTSEVFVWSSASVAGTPVREQLAQSAEGWEKFQHDIEQDVRFANITIIEGIGASQHGIGMVSARIAEMVVRDQRTVVPVGSYHPRYGVTLSVPSVIGTQGVVRAVEPDLSDDERAALQRSADWLKAAVARIKI